MRDRRQKMTEKINRFFKKHEFFKDDIKYIIREDGKTAIHLLDGRIIYTYNTIKELRESLSEKDFLYPNKGILLAASQIVNVSEGAYEMADGRTFKYRVHNSKLHDSRMLMLGRRMEQIQAVADAHTPEALATKYSIMDNMPFSICVIELIFDEHGLGTDFIVRYANNAFLHFEEKTRDEVIDCSFFEVFSNTDKHRLAVYSDVAVNNTVRVVKHRPKKLDCELDLYCYQPMEGYCTCVLVGVLDHIPQNYNAI